jgi:hypothetical protein
VCTWREEPGADLLVSRPRPLESATSRQPWTEVSCGLDHNSQLGHTAQGEGASRGWLLDQGRAGAMDAALSSPRPLRSTRASTSSTGYSTSSMIHIGITSSAPYPVLLSVCAVCACHALTPDVPGPLWWAWAGELGLAGMAVASW